MGKGDKDKHERASAVLSTKLKDVEGVPADLDLVKACEWMRPRVSEYRFKHVEGVALVAHELAEEAGLDVFTAELAGWLHDACKEVKDKELIVRAREYGLALHPVEEVYGYLLHGPVGAEAVRRELGVTNEEILLGIAEHTLGAVPMSDMSKVIFLADCLEAGRPKDFTNPIWHALGYKKSESAPLGWKLKGDLDLNKGMLVACDLSLNYLIEDGKIIHPKTVDVRNYFLKIVKERAAS